MKNKLVTFSYDDGVVQDRRLIQLLDRYNLKATFNLNSEWFGLKHTFTGQNGLFEHQKVERDEVMEIYKNHEVAVHTLTHAKLPVASDEEVIRQVEEDRRNLSELVGYEVLGMAYPGATNNHDKRTENLIKNHTGVRYCRTIDCSNGFDMPVNLYEIMPTVHHLAPNAYELCKKFVETQFESPKLLYIWGHSYELDYGNNWMELEKIFQLISGHDDIFYGTNKEILLNEGCHRK